MSSDIAVTPNEAHIAETRVVRAIAAVFGIGAVALFGVGFGSAVAEAPYLRGWWTPLALAVMFGVPPVLAVVSRVLSLRAMRIAFGGYAVAFLAVVLSFAPSMTGTPLPGTLSPWVLGATSLGAAAAALAWVPWLTWGYLLVNILISGLLRYHAGGAVDAGIALQNAVFSLGFTAIFTAIALVSVRNARAADRVAVAARVVAARVSAVEASLRERTRLDALVHDEILSTLLYASVGGPAVDEAVTRQARAALARLRGVEARGESVEPHDFESRLRAATALSAQVDFEAAGMRAGAIPAAVTTAFAEAAAEAVRNALAYAYADGRGPVRVRLHADRTGVEVRVADDGVGFSPRGVDAHRLGIRVSIVGRLAVVQGCTATVDSRLGAGTTVSLTWREA